MAAESPNEVSTPSQPPRRGRFIAAFAIAAAADLIQIVLAPLFFEGAISPLDDVLDVSVAAALTALLGWHWAFLPSLVAELVPGLDMVPFWTLAVIWAARGKKHPDETLKDVTPGRGK